MSGVLSEAENLREFLHAWNRAAADAGFAGSEYHNEPKAVFARVREQQEARLEAVKKLIACQVRIAYLEAQNARLVQECEVEIARQHELFKTAESQNARLEARAIAAEQAAQSHAEFLAGLRRQLEEYAVMFSRMGRVG